MKYAIALALVAGAGCNAYAQTGPNLNPPKSVWDIGIGGALIHQQSALQCDAVQGDFQRINAAMYDQVGLDVSCGYKNQKTNDTVTLYLSERNPALQQQDFDSAKASVSKITPDATPRDSALSAPSADLNWLRAGFAEKSGLVNSDLLLTSLSGWNYKIRATYLPADTQAVNDLIARIDVMVMKSAGAHLAACAAAPALVRNGTPMRDPNLMMTLTLSGIGGASLNLAKADTDAIWCAQTGFGIGSAHFVYWRNAAPGTSLVERITGPDGAPLVYVQKDIAAAEIARQKTPTSPLVKEDGYDVIRVTPDLLRLIDIYAGDPPMAQVAGVLTGPHPVLADFNKAAKKISLNANVIPASK